MYIIEYKNHIRYVVIYCRIMIMQIFLRMRQQFCAKYNRLRLVVFRSISFLKLATLGQETCASFLARFYFHV